MVYRWCNGCAIKRCRERIIAAFDRLLAGAVILCVFVRIFPGYLVAVAYDPAP